MRRLVSILFLLPLAGTLPAQVSLCIGTDVPLQYAASVDFQPHKAFSASAKVGIMTTPYNDAILGILAAFGTDPLYTNLIEEAFRVGTFTEFQANGHFGRNYAGLYGQIVDLRAGDAPKDLMEAALGVNIPNPPFNMGFPALELAMESRLYQVGIRYGRRFPIGDHFEVRGEIACSKNVGSKSTLTTNSRSSENLNALLDAEMKPIYKAYAWLPSLGVYMVWRLGKN